MGSHEQMVVIIAGGLVLRARGRHTDRIRRVNFPALSFPNYTETKTVHGATVSSG